MASRILVAVSGCALLVACTPDNGGSDGGTTSSSSSSSSSSSGGSSSSRASSSSSASGCGTLTFEGECDGTSVRYCYENQVYTIDCEGDYPDAGAVCTEINATYGFDCAAPAGATCMYVDDDGDPYSIFCTGTSPGCVFDDDSSACTTGLTACTDGQVGDCSGARVLLGCAEGQPTLLDCPSWNAACNAGQCEQTTAGNFCDDEMVFCGTGLHCADGGCLANPDGGVVTSSSGPQPSSGTPSSGPGSSSTAGGSSSAPGSSAAGSSSNGASTSASNGSSASQ